MKESVSWLGGGAEEVLINIGKMSETINEMKRDTSRRRKAQARDGGDRPSAATAEVTVPDRTRVQVQITAKKLTSLKALVDVSPGWV